MAGDWIKMRSNLRRHPKVVRLASALGADRLRVVGGLHAVWCLFDEHSEDGCLYGYTPSAVDEEIGWPGFCNLLIAIGWIESDGNDGLSLPEFDTHNGASAKRRAMEADRKRAERAALNDHPHDIEDSSASHADKKRTREEKRREEKKEKPSASGFDTFWTAYPKKEAKKDAATAFAKLNPNPELLAVMLAAVATKSASVDWTKDGGKFVPLPASWIRAERWTDEGVTLAAVGGDRIGSFL